MATANHTRGDNRLTDTALRRARLTTGKAVLQDGGGLILTLTETAGRRVARAVYRFRLGDKRPEMYLGTWPDKALAELRELRNAARELVRRSIDPREAAREKKEKAAAAKAKEEARLTLRGMFAKWDKLHLRRAYKDGGAEPRRYFEKEILPLLGDLPAEELTRSHVARVVDGALERGAPRVAAMLLTYLPQLSRWGLARGYLNEDPTAALSKASIKTNGPRERTLSDDELRTLARLLPEAGLPAWAPSSVWLLLATAARVGELLRSRWEHLDLERQEWHIPAENAKNARAHVVHLSPFAVARFRELEALREGPWVISGRTPGNPADLKGLAKLLKDRQRPEGAAPLAKRTAAHAQALILPGGPWTAHDLRRTAATLMQELGVLPAVIEKCLNHSEPVAIRRVYQRAEYVPERREAFARLGAHLERVARGEAGAVVALAERRA
jgi:integrase